MNAKIVALIVLCLLISGCPSLPVDREAMSEQVELARGDLMAASEMFEDEDLSRRALELADALLEVETALKSGADAGTAVGAARLLIDALIDDAGDRQDLKTALFLADRVLARVR